jgi:hypothetical protein
MFDSAAPQPSAETAMLKNLGNPRNLPCGAFQPAFRFLSSARLSLYTRQFLK